MDTCKAIQYAYDFGASEDEITLGMNLKHAGHGADAGTNGGQTVHAVKIACSSGDDDLVKQTSLAIV